MVDIEPGLYRHFKGKTYKVLGVAHHSDDLEDMVVYQHLDDGQMWVRPVSSFLETVDRDGKIQKRFTKC
jgi:hypothetical protein